MASIEEILSKTGMPEAALAPLMSNVNKYKELVAENNKRVAQVNAAKSENPNDPNYLDTLWAANAQTDPKIAEIEPQYQALVEQAEKLLKQLRDEARKHIPEQLSEESLKAVRTQVNESKPALDEMRKTIQAQFELFEALLGTSGVEIPDGGLVNLLPQAQSLKSLRGRKATTASGEVRQYKTRVGDVLVDGKSTAKDGKGKLDYAAEELSNKFDANRIPANRVTAEELEEAMFTSLGKPFRSLKSTELPDEHSFIFEKTVQVKNPNDDGTSEVPQKVKLTVRSVNWGDEKKAETPVETPKTEEKVNGEKADEKVENKQAPAKKTAAPAKK